MAHLRVKNGPTTGTIYDIKEDTITIGRDESATICIANSSTSRNHAEVFIIGNMCFIKDLDSRNGTFVNNEKINEELLQEGDCITIGGIDLIFETGIIKNNENISNQLSNADFSGPTTELSLEELGLETQEVSNNKDALMSIYKLSKITSTAIREDALLSQASATIHQILKAEGVYFFKLDKHNNKNITLKGKFECEGASMKMVSKSILKRVMKFGKAVLTLDASLDKRFNANESVVSNNIHSAISAPLISRGKIVGIVYALKVKLFETFDDSALKLLTLCGLQVGTAIDNFENIHLEQRHTTEMLNLLVRAVEQRFPDLVGHSQRVKQYATAIAENLNLDPTRIQEIQWAAMLHETGRLGLNDAELSNVSNEDIKLIQLSKKLILQINAMPNVLPIILNMFERYDGSGFPNAISGDDIPIEAQILGIANHFDMLTTFGLEDEPLSTQDAMSHIQDMTGVLFSIQISTALQATFSDGTLFLPFNKK